MKENDELPKDQLDGDELPQTCDPNQDGSCPTGYYYDEETKQCILDVG